MIWISTFQFQNLMRTSPALSKSELSQIRSFSLEQIFSMLVCQISKNWLSMKFSLENLMYSKVYTKLQVKYGIIWWTHSMDSLKKLHSIMFGISSRNALLENDLHLLLGSEDTFTIILFTKKTVLFLMRLHLTSFLPWHRFLKEQLRTLISLRSSEFIDKPSISLKSNLRDSNIKSVS